MSFISILWGACNVVFPNLNERLLVITTDVGLVIVIKLFLCLKDFMCLFRERERAGERGGEKHPCVRLTSVGCL